MRRTIKRFRFNTQEAVPAAWNFIWAKKKAAQEGKDPSAYRYSANYYTTVSDLVNQVRRFAFDTANGEAWGASGLAYGRDTYGIRLSGNVEHAVSDWLRRQTYAGKIETFNFGRNTSTGRRYRPAGMGLTEVEQKTMAAKERRKDRPVTKHFSDKGWGSAPMCVVEQRKKSGQRLWGFRRSKARVTPETEEVTCPRCRKLLEAAQAA